MSTTEHKTNENENNIILLAGKQKKGILRLIFSRLFLFVLLLAAQVTIIVSFFYWFSQYLPHFTGMQILFTICMVLYLFNSDMDSSAKLTWMIVISILPVPGAVFLAFSQTEIGHRAIKRKLEQNIRMTKDALVQSENTLRKLETEYSGTEDLWRYVNRQGRFPIYEHTQVTYFPLGEQMFEAMLRELERAETYIYLEYFIVEEGNMWGRILSILAEKAEQGVDVRVMYDGMCEISLLPYDYPVRVERLGIRCKMFSPMRPFLSTYYNYRDHRKILVIDGKVAFNGGVNLADEYINRKARFGHWKDTAVMLRGEAAESFALMFLQMWNVTELGDEQMNRDRHRLLEVSQWQGSPQDKTGESDGFVMPYADSPLDEDKVGENVYIDILYRATSYVHIMTPYLILDGELENALKYAAQRGVDVKIILPGIPDKKSAYALAKSNYRTLLDAGVKLYEYTPGFVHAKVFVSDDTKGVVGTINLDYRSLYHHFECATYLYKTACITEMEADFQETLTKCKEVSYETIRREKLYYKLLGSVLKLFAPLM